MRKAILFAIVCALSYTANAATLNSKLVSTSSSGVKVLSEVKKEDEQPREEDKDQNKRPRINNEDTGPGEGDGNGDGNGNGNGDGNDNGDDNGNGGHHDDDKGPDQDGDKGPDQDHGKGPGQDEDKDMSKFMRVDCRYHNVEKHPGVDHCYASAIYKPGDKKYSHVRFGVGCDQQTIYNDTGRVHIEQVGERISPLTAAFPGVEIFPQGALSNPGTYESVLDIRAGRLVGTCYVHRLGGWDHNDYSSLSWLY